MSDYIRGIRKADALIKKAKLYRDKSGYRENLGYDSRPNLTDYLSKLKLSYTDECRVLSHFDDACDGI